MILKPFWRYYGGKWRSAPKYPPPVCSTIIEPFAGAAGYSLRYPDRNVILVDKYPTICEIWKYLILADPNEILAIPEVDDIDDLPAWVPIGARKLVGFSMNSAAASPRKTLSAGRRKLRALNRQFEGWTPALKKRVADQVVHIRHWQIIEGDYNDAPDVDATWFVDPPYEIAGRHYVHWKVDYSALASWCKSRRGQVLVCESAAATWLPFQPHTESRGMGNRRSTEGLWTNKDESMN